MPDVRIVKVEVGDLQGIAVPDCVDGTSPFHAFLQDVDTGEVTDIYGCFNPLDPPCTDDGLCHVLAGGGYTVVDCGCD